MDIKVAVGRANRVSIGISVGVDKVGDGVATNGVCEVSGVAIVWLGKLHEVTVKTKIVRTIQQGFIHSSFSNRILIPRLDYSNSLLDRLLRVVRFFSLPLFSEF